MTGNSSPSPEICSAAIPSSTSWRRRPASRSSGCFERENRFDGYMTAAIFLIFSVVYLGMILGGLPFLQLDRTGVALLGAIALIGVEALSPEEAAKSIHLPTLILLFSFMVVSAQM